MEIEIVRLKEKVADFVLKADDMNEYKLSEHLDSKNILLFFYPKDDTSGWITEASEFRDIYVEISKYGFELYGISKDSVKTHNKFHEKLELNYHLLSDPERVVHKQFNVLKNKKMFGKDVVGTIRSSFIIDKMGILVKEFRDVKPEGHAKEVLDYVIKNYKKE